MATRIDAFNHFYPAAYYKKMEEVGSDLKDMFRRARAVQSIHDLDVRFKVMDLYDDYAQVLSLPAPTLLNVTGCGVAVTLMLCSVPPVPVNVELNWSAINPVLLVKLNGPSVEASLHLAASSAAAAAPDRSDVRRTPWVRVRMILRDMIHSSGPNGPTKKPNSREADVARKTQCDL